MVVESQPRWGGVDASRHRGIEEEYVIVGSHIDSACAGR